MRPAPAPDAIYTFDAFTLDVRARLLTCDGAAVPLSGPSFDLLATLVAHPGELLPHQALLDAAWPNLSVTANSLTQAILIVRRALGGRDYIETRARRGYRFVGPVVQQARPVTRTPIEAQLAAHRAFVEGRAALETLERGAIARTRVAFDEMVRQSPASATAHVGLANACALQFELTRTDALPDVATLQVALHHAQQACEIEARYGEAWATLGFVFERVGRRVDAQAALQHAVELEPDNWRHHLRLAAASWGEARLRAARRTLGLMPGLSMAHWLAASVLVARQLLPAAARELDVGLRQDGVPDGVTRFSGVALCWLRGLIALADDDGERAIGEFEHELAGEASGHLYARECAANTWYAIGATRLRQGDRDAAGQAFTEVLQRVPTHLLAQAALGHDRTQPAQALAAASAIDEAIAHAVARVAKGAAGGADEARAVHAALAAAPAGNAGWLLPVEPMLVVHRHREPWQSALDLLITRAR